MKHLDEHLIELYVLRTPEVAGDISVVEAHLAECAGCRSLAGELREFHADLREEIDIAETEVVIETKALIPRQSEMEPYYEPFLMPEPARPRTALGKFASLVRRHPLKMTAGSFGLAAGIGFLLLNANQSKPPEPVTDVNPSHYSYNLKEGTIEILNSQDQKLWQMKLENATDASSSERAGVIRTIITDLDADGENEVYTIESLAGFRDAGIAHLRVFDGQRQLLKDILFRADVPYSGGSGSYSPYFGLSSLVAYSPPQGGKRELLAVGNSYGRSPSGVVRINHKCEIVGRFWHFGGLGPMAMRDLNGDGVKELLVGGLNDVMDSIGISYPVLIALDPEKLIGEKRATACPGFLLPASDAERYYVQFPATDLDRALHTHASVTQIEENSPTILSVVTSSPYENERVNTYYLLDQAMNVVVVKTSTPTISIREQLIAKGILHGRMDDDYFRKLRKEVQYWDGYGWKYEMTKVKLPANVQF